MARLLRCLLKLCHVRTAAAVLWRLVIIKDHPWRLDGTSTRACFWIVLKIVLLKLQKQVLPRGSLPVTPVIIYGRFQKRTCSSQKRTIAFSKKKQGPLLLRSLSRLRSSKLQVQACLTTRHELSGLPGFVV